MYLKTILAVTFIATLTAEHLFSASVNFNFYVDDYATVMIDGTLVGSYDNPAAAGNIVFTDDLAPGLHTFAIDYANQFGTNFLSLSWQLPGASALSVIPLADFSSLDQDGDTISGLRADYYSSLGGSYLFTVYGEGPISNGALSFTSEIYEGEPGLWAGVFGPSSLFAEDLSGEIDIPGGSPEPSTTLLIGAPLLAFLFVRLRGAAFAGWRGGRRSPRAG